MNKFLLKPLICILIAFAGITSINAQHIAAKTNLLYGIYTFTPNLGLEVGLGKRSTIDMNAGYNWFENSTDSGKKTIHWLGNIEYRYWTCQRFNGHFFGIHALGMQYNIAGHNLPLLFGKGSDIYRYEGWGIGAGLSYGYSFYLGKRWSLEAALGIGYARLHYDKFNCGVCGKKTNKEQRNYFGPTKISIALVYIIK